MVKREGVLAPGGAVGLRARDSDLEGPMTRRHTEFVLVLGMLMACAPLAIDMYLPSIPTLERELSAGAGQAQFTLAAYFIGMAIGQAFYGPLADRFGRKPPLYAGMILFVLGSVACALAPTIESLVVARFVQALGGSAGMVIALAMVRDLFDPKTSARVFSQVVLVMGVAPVLAPLVGGYVLAAAGWRAIFWALAGFGLVCLASVALRLLETRPVGSGGPAGIGAALQTYFRLARDARFVGYAFSGGLAAAGMFAYISGSPHVLIDLYGVPPQAYGWIFSANALGLIVASQFNRWLLARFTPDAVLARAFMMVAFSGVALVLLAKTNAAGLAGILVPLFFYVASLGFVNPNASAGALADQAERAGSASALLRTLQFGMATVAGALVGALHNASALPMAGVIAACGVDALVMHRRLIAVPRLATSGGGNDEIRAVRGNGAIDHRIAQEALTRGHAIIGVGRDPARSETRNHVPIDGRQRQH